MLFKTKLHVDNTTVRLLTVVTLLLLALDLKSPASNLSGEQLGQSVTLAITGLTYLATLALRYGQRNSTVVARRTRSLQGMR